MNGVFSSLYRIFLPIDWFKHGWKRSPLRLDTNILSFCLLLSYLTFKLPILSEFIVRFFYQGYKQRLCVMLNWYHFHKIGTKVARFSLCAKKRRLLICKYTVFTYVRKPVQKGEKSLTKWWLTLQGHNFVNNGPILTILVPIDSQGKGLLIGTRMVEIGPLLTKLW